MTKEKEELRVCQMTLAIIIVISFLYIFWSVARYDTLKSEYYNYRAEKECPMMQYETEICKWELNYCERVKLSWTNLSNIYRCYTLTSDFNVTIYNDERVPSYSKEICDGGKNFTTGRYIDGKIECLANSNWLSQNDISKNFTLEEFGIE